MKIIHLTSVHTRFDVRIFLKECVSLAKYSNSVSLIVADGKGDELKNNINIYDVGIFRGRLERIRNAPDKILKKAIELDADIYHLHDPELLTIALKLKKEGKKVIFDAHEDVPTQIISKPYIAKPLRRILSKLVAMYEKYICSRLDCVVAATPHIRDKFRSMGIKSLDINNYPLLNEGGDDKKVFSLSKNKVCYVGGISSVRGAKEIIEAMAFVKYPDVKLALAGIFNEAKLEESLKSMTGWSKVDYIGWLNRDEVQDIYAQSFAGLVTLHPILNYIDALPVKMFEYMNAGIPVIASNFPLWRNIIEESKCGICVDPLNSEEIARIINYLSENPNIVRDMGANGKRAILEKYNWNKEEKKLVNLYFSLMNERAI